MSRDRLVYKLLRELRRRGLQKVTECADLASLKCNNVLACMIDLLRSCKEDGIVILGVDPGENVGLILLFDSIVLWEWQGPKEQARLTIKELVNMIPIDVTFVGEGGEDLIPSNVKAVVVNEFGTSKFRGKLGRHALSAYLIALRNSVTRRKL